MHVPQYELILIKPDQSRHMQTPDTYTPNATHSQSYQRRGLHVIGNNPMIIPVIMLVLVRNPPDIPHMSTRKRMHGN